MKKQGNPLELQGASPLKFFRMPPLKNPTHVVHWTDVSLETKQCKTSYHQLLDGTLGIFMLAIKLWFTETSLSGRQWLVIKSWLAVTACQTSMSVQAQF